MHRHQGQEGAGLAAEQRGPDQVQVFHGARSSGQAACDCCSTSVPLSRCSVCDAYSAAFGSWVTMTMVLPWSRLSSCSSSASPRRTGGRGRRSARRRPAASGRRRSRARSPRAAAGRRTARSACATARSARPTSCQRDLGVALALRAAEAWSAAAAARRSLRGQHRHQVVELEHEADMVGCATARAGRRPCWSMRSPSTSISPDGRRVEPADQVEQGGLAGARRAHQRDEVALVDVEVDAVQHFDLLAGRAGRSW